MVPSIIVGSVILKAGGTTLGTRKRVVELTVTVASNQDTTLVVTGGIVMVVVMMLISKMLVVVGLPDTVSVIFG